tara:strand:+ start:595 stop:1005 length:411 start_codon:yes stop_codon:yes gene_type:complete
MKPRFFYFRTQATDADDDASRDSVCFPVSSIKGMEPTSDTELTIYFDTLIRSSNGGSVAAVDGVASLENHDKVALTIPANQHLKAILAIADAAYGDNYPTLVIVANDDADPGTEYLAGSGITACGAINVAIAYANS